MRHAIRVLLLSTLLQGSLRLHLVNVEPIETIDRAPVFFSRIR